MLLQGSRPGGAEGRAATATAARLLSRHALLLVVGVGALVRFATLASQDYWLDEYQAIGIIQLDPGEIIDRTTGNNTSPPLYFLIAAGWERVFGTDEVALRSLSALFGTATIPIAYAAGVALGSRRAGLFAAALMASSPLMIWYSQEARPYALFALLSAISFLCFVHALNGRGRGWLGGWAAASVLALATHYFAIFLIVAEAAWLLSRPTRDRRAAAIAIAIVGAPVLALLSIAAERTELGGWIEWLDRSDRVLQVPQHFVVGLNTPWQAVAPVATLATLLVAFRAFLRAEAEARRIVAVAGSVTLIGAGLPLAAALA
ncbi:MAG: glycosyltransferase family 39 protein, partial [Solirubrobacterales bacterium]